MKIEKETREEMIEAIREKVVMANNPNAIDLVHALELEFKHNDCLVQIVEHYDLGDEDVMNGDEYLAICTKELWKEHYDCSLEQYQHQECVGGHLYSIKKIIGRPLTLERILVALNFDILKVGYSIMDKPYFTIYNNFGIIQFLWQPNKTLENQTDNTISALHHILCSTK